MKSRSKNIRKQAYEQTEIMNFQHENDLLNRYNIIKRTITSRLILPNRLNAVDLVM